MNIKDIVKFDERSEAILNKRFDHRLQLLAEKFDGFSRSNNIIYLEKRQAILDEKERMLTSFKSKNVPVRDESLLAGMAIEWAEANGYTSFTQAMKEVMNEAVSDDDMKNFDADLLKETSRYDRGGKFVYEDISLEEAKRMYGEVHPYNPISDAIVQESLDLYRRMLRPQEANDDNAIYFSDWKCTLKVDGHQYDIPVMAFKQLIATMLGINESSGEDWVKKVRAIKLPDLDIRWPRE